MADDAQRPWWQSTFSIVTVILSAGFTSLCILMKDVVSLKEATLMVLAGYGVKKGMEMGKNGNGGSHELPEAPASGTPPATTP